LFYSFQANANTRKILNEPVGYIESEWAEEFNRLIKEPGNRMEKIYTVYIGHSWPDDNQNLDDWH